MKYYKYVDTVRIKREINIYFVISVNITKYKHMNVYDRDST